MRASRFFFLLDVLNTIIGIKMVGVNRDAGQTVFPKCSDFKVDRLKTRLLPIVGPTNHF